MGNNLALKIILSKLVFDYIHSSIQGVSADFTLNFVVQGASGHDVRAAVVPDVVRAQPQPLLGRGAAVRLLPVRAAAVPCVRHGRHRAAPGRRGARVRRRYGDAALLAIQGKSTH